MPIYEYNCQVCKKNFDLIRPMSQAAEKGACPKCGAASERALSRFACLSADASGYTKPLSGTSCGGCASGSCSTCGG